MNGIEIQLVNDILLSFQALEPVSHFTRRPGRRILTPTNFFAAVTVLYVPAISPSLSFRHVYRNLTRYPNVQAYSPTGYDVARTEDEMGAPGLDGY